MAILVRGLTLELDEPIEQLPLKAARRLRIDAGQIRHWAIVRRSLDARRKDRLRFDYNIELALAETPQKEARLINRLHRQDVTIIDPKQPPKLSPGTVPLPERPVIVGFGPAGMFAGLLLAEMGFRPLILERGRDVSSRHRDIMVDFYRHGKFHPESNLLYGEGGAGTYSDGKLYTRLNDPRIRQILETFYHHGADPKILIDGRPHIGSDKLPGICRRIRLHIEKLGGEVRFESRLDDLAVEKGRLTGLVVNSQKISCGPTLLALGLSARDTFRMLHRRGVQLATKPWQLGVRIEHPQEMVDRWQYGGHVGHCQLPPAEYHLIAKKVAGTGGDMFSFCMCPGGMILPTNESAGLVATNGASRARRGGPFANAGLVVTLRPEDIQVGDPNDPLAILDTIETIERRAFEMTGGTYAVPAQRACDFTAGRLSDGNLQTSYPLGGKWSDLHRLLPADVAQAIARGIAHLDERLPGFGGAEGVIAAPETRASSPLRIVRDRENHVSTTVDGLYPVGEGAGFAGGIISAALDGLMTAEKIITRYAPL